MAEEEKAPDTPEVQSPESSVQSSEPTPPQDALADAQAQAAEYLSLAQHVQAEFLNYRKRVSRERDEVRLAVAREWAATLLPMLDHLQLAAAAAGDADTIRQGVQMIASAFTQALTQLGVEPVVALGERFDPERHEAIGVVVTADAAPGTIVAESQRGWSLGGRVLRAPRVQVATAPAAAPAPPTPADGAPTEGAP